MAAMVPRLAVHYALPEAPAGPRLQHRHADSEGAQHGQNLPAELRAAPAALRQRDEQAGRGVEKHRSGRAEQEAEAGREDPAEGLAEHPDQQPHPALAAPANRLAHPGGAAISHAPRPT